MLDVFVRRSCNTPTRFFWLLLPCFSGRFPSWNWRFLTTFLYVLFSAPATAVLRRRRAGPVYGARVGAPPPRDHTQRVLRVSVNQKDAHEADVAVATLGLRDERSYHSQGLSGARHAGLSVIHDV